MQRNWGTLVVVLVVAVALLSMAAVTSQPPSAETRADVASALEAVLPVLDETGVTEWADSAPQPEGAEGDKIADAVAGVVPGGRVTSIEVGNGTATFVVAPRLFGVMDSPLAEWVWTWHAEAVSPDADDVSATWTFEARRPDRGASAASNGPAGSPGQGLTGVPTVSSAAASSATLASGDASAEYA